MTETRHLWNAGRFHYFPNFPAARNDLIVPAAATRTILTSETCQRKMQLGLFRLVQPFVFPNKMADTSSCFDDTAATTKQP